MWMFETYPFTVDMLSQPTRDLLKALEVTPLNGRDFMLRTGVPVPFGSAGCYMDKFDAIGVLNITCELTSPEFTVLHELIHWTGVSKRANRRFMAALDGCSNWVEYRGKFASGDFERLEQTEEACAQLGAGRLAQRLGVYTPECAKYLRNYLDVLPMADLEAAMQQAHAALQWIQMAVQSSSKPKELDCLSKAA